LAKGRGRLLPTAIQLSISRRQPADPVRSADALPNMQKGCADLHFSLVKVPSNRQNLSSA
jgi:hypothetical protein